MLQQLVTAASVLVLFSSLRAADPPAAAPDPAQLEAQMAALAQLGPQHAAFKHLVGEWDCECRNFGVGEPQTWKATANFRLILDGRYLQQEFSGTMPGNLPYAGQGLTGYDNGQQKYVGTWVDSMGTGIMHTSGEQNAETGVITEIGTAQTPAGEMQFKMVTEHKSADEFLFTMSLVSPAGDQKMMEIAYKRKK